MRRVTCSYCGQSRGPAAGSIEEESGLFQVTRFPSVYLHHRCIVDLRNRIRILMGNESMHYAHPLIDHFIWWPKSDPPWKKRLKDAKPST